MLWGLGNTSRPSAGQCAHVPCVSVLQLSFPAYSFETGDKRAGLSVLMSLLDPANAGKYDNDNRVCAAPSAMPLSGDIGFQQSAFYQPLRNVELIKK